MGRGWNAEKVETQSGHWAPAMLSRLPLYVECRWTGILPWDIGEKPPPNIALSIVVFGSQVNQAISNRIEDREVQIGVRVCHC